MFDLLVSSKKTRDQILKEHAINHHPTPKVKKCSTKHPCSGSHDPDTFDVQVRGTFGGDYGPSTYNVGDIWGGRQI